MNGLGSRRAAVALSSRSRLICSWMASELISRCMVSESNEVECQCS